MWRGFIAFRISAILSDKAPDKYMLRIVETRVIGNDIDNDLSNQRNSYRAIWLDDALV